MIAYIYICEKYIHIMYVCVYAKSYPTLSNPMDCSPPTPPDSSVQGIFQVKILKWIAISYSRESFQSRDRT